MLTSFCGTLRQGNIKIHLKRRCLRLFPPVSCENACVHGCLTDRGLPQAKQKRGTWAAILGKRKSSGGVQSTGVSHGVTETNRDESQSSSEKKEHKPELLGPDIFRWGGGLPCEGVGAKDFGMSLETPGKPNFWAGYPPVVARMSWMCPKCLRKKGLCISGRRFRKTLARKVQLASKRHRNTKCPIRTLARALLILVFESF